MLGIPGHLVTNGLQGSGLLAEQPGPAAARLLEQNLLTHHKYIKKLSVLINQVHQEKSIWKECTSSARTVYGTEATEPG